MYPPGVASEHNAATAPSRAGASGWARIAAMPDPYRGAHKGYGAQAGIAYAQSVAHCVAAIRKRTGAGPAAFIAEVVRGGVASVPAGQWEAARSLGFSPLQTLRLVRAPQAFRLALAPMTNDFVALLKDSSLVSVLTVMELTKQTPRRPDHN